MKHYALFGDKPSERLGRECLGKDPELAPIMELACEREGPSFIVLLDAHGSMLESFARVQVFEHGAAMVSYNGIPVTHLGVIGGVFGARGWNTVNLRLGNMVRIQGMERLAPIMVFTSTEGGERWIAEIEAHNAASYNRIDQWVRGGDVGTSAMTMFKCLGDEYVERGVVWGHVGLGCGQYAATSVPYDRYDFGRCRRMQAMFAPDPTAMFAELISRYPEWQGICESWNELCEMHERDEDMSARLRLLVQRSRDAHDLAHATEND